MHGMKPTSYTISEALAILRRGDVVNLQFVTADVKAGTGGRRLEVMNCQKVQSRFGEKETGSITIAELDKRQHPITVHVPLIEKLNGVPVV